MVREGGRGTDTKGVETEARRIDNGMSQKRLKGSIHITVGESATRRVSEDESVRGIAET